jgi:hypothetical protein
MKCLLRTGSLGLALGLLSCFGGSTVSAGDGKADLSASFREQRGQVTWSLRIGEKSLSLPGTYELYRDPAAPAGWAARIR